MVVVVAGALVIVFGEVVAVELGIEGLVLAEVMTELVVGVVEEFGLLLEWG